MVAQGVESLLKFGYKPLKGVLKDGCRVFRRICCDNGSWNASKGARGAAMARGGMTGGRYNIPVGKPAGTITTDFVMVDANGNINRMARRCALNAPQGQKVQFMRANAGDAWYTPITSYHEGRKFLG